MTQPFTAAVRRLFVSARGRSFGLFFLTSLGSRGLGIACQLLQVPIALSVLGAEAFGLWMTLNSFTYLINFADFGVGIGVQNKIAEAFSVEDRGEARALFHNAFAFLLAIAACLTGVLIPLSLVVNPTGIFGLSDSTVIDQAPLAMAAVVATFCLNFPLGLAQRLAYGLQKGWMHNVSQALSNVVGLAALFAAARMHSSLSVIILATTIPMVISNAALLVILLRPLRWLSLRGFTLRLDLIKDLLGLGALFSIQQVLSTVVYSLPAIIISASLGAAAVTPFNLCQRLFNLFAVVQNAFMLPLWPAYSEAKARGEFAWIRQALLRSISATCILTILPMTLGAAFAPWILRHWVGDASAETMPSTLLIWLLCAWNAILFLQQTFGFLLAGVSEVRRLTVYSIANAVFAVPLMIWLAGWMGQSGVVLGLMLAFLPCNMLGSVFESIRYLRRHPPTDAEANPALATV